MLSGGEWCSGTNRCLYNITGKQAEHSGLSAGEPTVQVGRVQVNPLRKWADWPAGEPTARVGRLAVRAGRRTARVSRLASICAGRRTVRVSRLASIRARSHTAHVNRLANCIPAGRRMVRPGRMTSSGSGAARRSWADRPASGPHAELPAQLRTGYI